MCLTLYGTASWPPGVVWFPSLTSSVCFASSQALGILRLSDFILPSGVCGSQCITLATSRAACFLLGPCHVNNALCKVSVQVFSLLWKWGRLLLLTCRTAVCRLDTGLLPDVFIVFSPSLWLAYSFLCTVF